MGVKLVAPPAAHVIQPGNIEDQLATVDVANVGAVRAFWQHFYGVAAVAVIDLVALWEAVGQAHVTLLRAGKPPARNFAGLPRIAKIHDDVELIVLRIRRTRILRAGSQMRELAVDKPHVVDARRSWPGSVEEGKRKILQFPR